MVFLATTGSNFSFFTGLLSFRHLKGTNYEDRVSLGSISHDVLQEFNIDKTTSDVAFKIMVKMKPKNHFSSLHFSARLVGEDYNSKHPGTFVYLGEQLTVAYFKV